MGGSLEFCMMTILEVCPFCDQTVMPQFLLTFARRLRRTELRNPPNVAESSLTGRPFFAIMDPPFPNHILVVTFSPFFTLSIPSGP